jgi:predicted nuclease with TOPRIM domain
MAKITKKSDNSDIVKKVEKLLSQQTNTILNAVDKRLAWQTKESNDKFSKISKENIEIKQSINQLTITLDKFLKRLTDFEDELEIMKAKVTKIEKILLTKLGVSLS